MGIGVHFSDIILYLAFVIALLLMGFTVVKIFKKGILFALRIVLFVFLTLILFSSVNFFLNTFF